MIDAVVTFARRRAQSLILSSLLRPCRHQTQGSPSFATRVASVERRFSVASAVGVPLGKTRSVTTTGAPVMTVRGGRAGGVPSGRPQVVMRKR